MAAADTTAALAPRLAEAIRNRLISGEMKPGQTSVGSRIECRFRGLPQLVARSVPLLTKEGLLHHEPNRGVFVATPSMASIIDIYRVRRMVEGQALANAYPNHPAVGRMRAAVEAAREARDRNDWTAVGSENMKFHAAIVDLADSQRLNGFYAQIAAELRLSFGLLREPELLHAPYVEMNAAILEKLEAGEPKAAAASLEAYLLQSERTVLAAFSRI